MSTELPIKTLGEYVAALIAALGRAHPSTLARMRLVVGRRRARIILDDEAIEVFFDPEGRLHVLPAPEGDGVDGEGATDTATVRQLLDGDVEVSGAVLSGRLRVVGSDADVVRMFTAIEILLDASPRTPSLQALAERFMSERRAPFFQPTEDFGRVSWYPFGSASAEVLLLARLDLLPDDSA
jgi:hypothetical protein